MVDRVAATISIGGTLPSSLLEAFIGLVEDEALAPEWDGEPFTAADLPADGPLMLMASEVAWGEFRALESFCVEHRLPFARWHQSNCGTWGSERAVFTGEGEVRLYAATDDDTVMLDRETAMRLGSIEAIVEYFDIADAAPPRFQVVPGPQRHSRLLVGHSVPDRGEGAFGLCERNPGAPEVFHVLRYALSPQSGAFPRRPRVRS